MMSYLWILLLGSLLAASAKAQDDTEEAAAAVTQAPEAEADADAAPEANGESNADEKTLTDEEILPTQSAPISPPVAGADDAVEGDAEALTPAAEDAEAVTPAAEDSEAAATPAAGDAEAVTPADEDTEAAVTPAVGDAEAVTPAAGDAEVMNPAAEDTEVAATTAAGDVEAAGDAEAVTPAVAADAGEEAAATTPEPVADPEPIANGEGEPEHLDSAQEGDATTDPPAANNEEETTAPAVDLPVKEKIPAPDNADTFDLGDAVDDDTADNKRPGARAFGDALNTGDNNENPGISSPESGPHSAGAKDDNAGGQEAGSGSLAAILSTIGVAAVGAVTGYFTYQKKKLCFKNREEADPEAARKADAAEAQSDPQVLSNLLNSS